MSVSKIRSIANAFCISLADAELLYKNGFKTVKSIRAATIDTLAKIEGLDLQTVVKLCWHTSASNRKSKKNLKLDSKFKSLAVRKPKIICTYLIHKSGILISKHERVYSILDTKIFASMLTALSSFVQISMQRFGATKSTDTLTALTYGPYRIIIESSTNLKLVAVILGNETKEILSKLKRAITLLDSMYSNVLSDWDGDTSCIRDIDKWLKLFITRNIVFKGTVKAPKKSEGVSKKFFDKFYAMRKSIKA
jgi:hypothetical protein